MAKIEKDAQGFYIIPGMKRLSPSALKSYHQCPRCFKRYSMDGERPLRDKTHIAMLIGSAVHSGVETAREAIKKANDPSPKAPIPYEVEKCIAAALATFENEAKKYPIVEVEKTPYKVYTEAVPDVHKLVTAALEKICLPERAIGIGELEKWVDFDHVDLPETGREFFYAIDEANNKGAIFPFHYGGYMDCELKDFTIKDLKTANSAGLPDPFQGIQLATYALPRFKSRGKLSRVVIDQLVKNENCEVISYPIALTPEHLNNVHEFVLDTARAILKEAFPPRPGFSCKFDHALPAFTITMPMIIEENSL